MGWIFCKECKKNICDNCLNEYSIHTIIPFFQIGLNDNEIKRMKNIFKNIDNILNKFN
jgi:hypothetical protein